MGFAVDDDDDARLDVESIRTRLLSPDLLPLSGDMDRLGVFLGAEESEPEGGFLGGRPRLRFGGVGPSPLLGVAVFDDADLGGRPRFFGVGVVVPGGSGVFTFGGRPRGRLTGWPSGVLVPVAGDFFASLFLAFPDVSLPRGVDELEPGVRAPRVDILLLATGVNLLSLLVSQFGQNHFFDDGTAASGGSRQKV